MKHLLVGAAAAAAIFVAASNPAAAATSRACVGGYQTLANGTMVPCKGSSMAEPATTASIGTVAAPMAPAPIAQLPHDPSGCQPGGYWMQQLDNSELPIKCR
jgi:hypothetical protein